MPLHGTPETLTQLREKLFNKDIDGFIGLVSSVLTGVPYLSRKKKFNEGHFQTMLQLLLTVLGFEPSTEEVLANGRIDMQIRLGKLTIIFEFKYTKGDKSQARKALQQIKDNDYASKYKLVSSEIIGVGVSFSEGKKNINGHIVETLFVAQ